MYACYLVLLFSARWLGVAALHFPITDVIGLRNRGPPQVAVDVRDITRRRTTGSSCGSGTAQTGTDLDANRRPASR